MNSAKIRFERSLKHWTTLAWLWLAPFGLCAQLSERDTLPFAYRLGLQGNYLSGNVERLLLMGSVDVLTRSHRWAFRSANTYYFGSFGSFRTENDLLARQFIYYNPDLVVYPYLMIWAETHERRQLDYRIQYGPGITWTALRKPAQLMKVSLTLSAEQARYRSDSFRLEKYDGSIYINLLRATARLAGQHRIGQDHWSVQYETWFQPSLENPKNYRLLGETAIRYLIKGTWALQMQIRYSRESVVPEDVVPGDVTGLFGVSMGSMNK